MRYTQERAPVGFTSSKSPSPLPSCYLPGTFMVETNAAVGAFDFAGAAMPCSPHVPPENGGRGRNTQHSAGANVPKKVMLLRCL
jgi:hypothetical protein